ncbi:MAG: hypothetical protein HPY54_09890 [Chthonomonadetes bacterium]|nr:hypothetical protein [Chthonomonadetes bacterium]
MQTHTASLVINPDSPVMKLDEIGLYTIGYAYRGQSERLFPPGWSGYFEERTGIACQPVGLVESKQAFLLHCPWRGGTGVTFQTFTFRLPKVKRALLKGFTAMRPDIVNQSDGVTFRIFVNGKKVMEEHRTDARWKPFSIDLSGLMGQTVAIRFETDPGPKDNPSFDFSLWAERELVLEGFQPKPVSRPTPPPMKLQSLLSAPTGTIAPRSAFTGRTSVEVRNDLATFRYAGADGVLEYRWRRPQRDDPNPLGGWTLWAQMKGDTPVQVPLATAAGLEWTAEATPIDVQWAKTGKGVVCTRRYRVGNETATLRIEAEIYHKSLVLTVQCDRGVVRTFNAGGWGPVLRRQQVVTPFYGGQVFYLPVENLFVNAILDWTEGHATAHDGLNAVYNALTDGTRNLLRERIVFTAAWHLAEVLPNIPNPPSPFRKQIGDKIVLDIWGGRYVDIAQDFERLTEYGITNCIALIHVWQRSGYDNALPMHIPAMAELGGDEGMKVLVGTGVRLGYYVALHENYVDYYPNYDHYDENDIALDSEGKKQLAWYNPGTKIQSFAVKPNAILRLASTQSPEIHRRYGTNACYLDVHSAVPPWFHVDMRAGEEGAGMFRRVWDVHRQLWEYERKTHGGPVFGEGNNHWYWSGCLDGVEAQFGTGWSWGQGLSAPLAVDFDLLKIHPLQFNHGMGYYERWWSNAKWGAVPPMVILDQYRVQEVAYGHAGFLGGAVWNLIPYAWLEHHLLSPVMARYATASPVEIQYHVGGKWVDSTAAAKAGSFGRVRVRYDSGLTIIANSTPEPLRAGALTLPRFGWLATGAGVTAYTALRQGVVVDYAETANTFFANARNARHWNLTGLKRIRPEVARFEQTGARTFRVTYRWRVNDTLERDYLCFVHFSQLPPEPWDEGIKFQQDHPLPKPTTQWRRGEEVIDGEYTVTVPENIPDGDYQWTIGLFVPGGGRVNMEGEVDRHGRNLLGVLQIRDGGRSIRFVPERSTGEERLALYTTHLNTEGKVIDFGSVRTNGSVFIRRRGQGWELIAMPRDDDFVIELNTSRFPVPERVQCVDGDVPAVQPVLNGKWWRLRLSGARAYRW